MERCRNWQNDCLPCSLFLKQLCCLFYSLCRPRNNRLTRTVEVDGLNSPHSTCLSTDGNDRIIIESEHGGHRSLAYWNGLLHIGTALVYKKNSILERQNPRCHKCGIFAKTVTCRDLRLNALRTQEFCRNDGHRKNRRLGMFGQLQLICRSLEAKLANGIPKRLIRLGKALLRKIIRIEKIFSHTDDLCALSREQESNFPHIAPPHS